ncbi:MAG: hypothetical protein DMG38_24740 [Acidobacteria bacterium]|nr:MAG: hypothetical protein DMG38_24740 [Acidobacteriota bacterium]
MTTKPITAALTPEAASGWRTRGFQIAWGLALCFYFLEYASRSAPAVMIQHLTAAFGTTAIGVSAILGTYYYTYSITSLIAGAALDRAGAKKAVPVGIFILAVGCLLFSVPTMAAGYAGRLLQGAGSAFAFTGGVYLAAHGFSGRWLATAIGVTQCLGMLGGSAGQSVVGPLLEHGVGWQTIWHWLGTASVAVGVLLLVITPREPHSQSPTSPWASVLNPYLIVFRNPQSYLCGAVAGLLFVPTTIGDMTWGVAFFQRATDENFLISLNLGVLCVSSLARIPKVFPRRTGQRRILLEPFVPIQQRHVEFEPLPGEALAGVAEEFRRHNFVFSWHPPLLQKMPVCLLLCHEVL